MKESLIEDVDLETVKKIRRLAEVLVELGQEYEKQPKPDTIAVIKQRIEELSRLAKVLDLGIITLDGYGLFAVEIFELRDRVKFLRANLLPFVLWIEVSLLAIAFIGDRPYLGLAMAVLGGVVTGLAAIAGYESVEQMGTGQKAGEGSDTPREES